MRQPSFARRSSVEMELLEPRLLLDVDPSLWAGLRMDMLAGAQSGGGGSQVRGGSLDFIGDPGPVADPAGTYVPQYGLISDYDWWFGCAPTSAGMLLEWWEDVRLLNVFPGDPNHWEFGQYPADSFDTYSVPDYSNGAVAGWWHFYDQSSWYWHTPDSLADFMGAQSGYLESWVDMLDAWWGLKNQLAWDDPRTAEDESYVADLLLDWVTDVDWIDNPDTGVDNTIVAAEDGVPSETWFGVVIEEGFDLLERLVDTLYVEITSETDLTGDVVGNLTVSVISPSNVEVLLTSSGSGVFEMPNAGALAGSDPLGTWIVKFVNAGDEEIFVDSLLLRVVDGWSYEKYTTTIDSGLPVMLLWEGLPEGVSTDPDMVPLGHYSLGVGYYDDPTTVDVAETLVDHYTTWNKGLRRWEWTEQLLNTTFTGPDSLQLRNADYLWSIKGALGINGLTQPEGLTAYYALAHERIGDLAVELGIGDPDDPDWSTRLVTDYLTGQAQVPAAMAVGDLDGDGYDDVVVVSPGGAGNGTASIFMNPQGAPDGLTGPTTFAVGRDPRDVEVADVNADGFMDIVVLNLGGGASPNSITVLRGDGAGGYVPVTSTISVIGGGPYAAMAVGDLTGDVKLEIVLVSNVPIAGSEDDRVVIMSGDALGSYSLSTTVPLGLDPDDGVSNTLVDVAVGNVGGDALTDIVVAVGGPGAASEHSRAFLLLNDAGMFAADPGRVFDLTSSAEGAELEPRQLLLADVDNRDERNLLEILVLHDAAGDAVLASMFSMLVGLGGPGGPNGDFTAPLEVPTGGYEANYMVVDDVLGDEALEIIVSDADAGVASVFGWQGEALALLAEHAIDSPVALGVGQFAEDRLILSATGSSGQGGVSVIFYDEIYGIPSAYADMTNYVQAGVDLSEALAFLQANPQVEERWYIKVVDTRVSEENDGWIMDFQIRYDGRRWFTADRDTPIIQPDADTRETFPAVATVFSGVVGNISGTVWDDLDGDGVRDTETVVVAPHPSSLPLDIIDGEPDWPDAALSEVNVSGIGASATLIDVNVSLSITHPEVSDLIIKLVKLGPDGMTPVAEAVLFDGQGRAGANITGIVFDDEAELGLGRGVPPYRWTFRPEESLSEFVGVDANGWWQLVVLDGVAGQAGTVDNWSLELVTSEEPGLAGWTVNLDSAAGPVSVVTDALGRYSLPGLLAGTCTVSVEAPGGWVASTRQVSTGELLGQDVAGADFGYYQPATIDGTVWDEPDRVVFLDEDGDGTLDWTDSAEAPNAAWDDGEGERWTLTDADGYYQFLDVVPGDYDVRVQVDPGWVVSQPAEGFYALNVRSKDVYGGLDFAIGVGDLPDLVDAGDDYSDFGNGLDPASTVIRPGESWRLRWRVENTLGVPAEAFSVAFYASVDDSLETMEDNYLLVIVPVAGLAGGAVAYIDSADHGSLFASFPSIPVGDYYVGAVIDSAGVVAETDESNNTAIDHLTGSEDPRVLHVPGLRGVVWADRNGNATRDEDDPGLPDRRVFLDGYRDGATTHPADGVLQWADRNANGLWDPGEGERWTRTNANGVYSLTGLPSGVYRIAEEVPPGWTQTFPNPDGNPLTVDVHVVSYVDGTQVSRDFGVRPGVDLRNETNGTLYSGYSPGSVNSPGGSLTIWWDVHNEGAGSAGPFTVEFYASADNDVSTTADNYLLGSVEVDGVAPNSHADVTLALLGVPVLPAGAYYVGVVIDSSDAVVETNEANNTAMDDAYPLVVANLPDLQEHPEGNGQFSPTVVHAGDQWGAWWTIRNQGLVPAGHFDVGFYLSENAVITVFDTLLGTVQVDALGAGETTNVHLSLFDFPEVPVGTYYIGIVIDDPAGMVDMVDESNEGNNIAVARQLLRVPGVQGTVFHDTNGDAVRAEDEPGLPGWRIRVYTDGDADGQLDVEDVLLRVAVANELGTYFLTGLPGGNYIVEENLLAGRGRDDRGRGGWLQTAPISRIHAISIGADAAVSGLDFGNVLPSLIWGNKWMDLDGNGVNDFEPYGPGFEIYLDENNNGTLDAAEQSVLTGLTGQYELRDVYPGLTFVREVLPAGFLITYPLLGAHAVNVMGGRVFAGLNFGNARPVRIYGYKWNDKDGDGIVDAGEPRLSGWTIFLDTNGDNTLNGNELAAVTDANGMFEFTKLRPGVYTVCEVQQPGWEQSLPGGIDPTRDWGWVGELRSGQSAQALFGNFMFSSISGYKWHDLDADGAWKTGTEPGLNDWEIQLWIDQDADGLLSSGDSYLQSTTTGPHPVTAQPGYYEFTNLVPDDYIVIEFMLTTREYNVGLVSYSNDPEIPPEDWASDDVHGLSQQGLNGIVIDLYQDLDENGVLSEADIYLGTTITGPNSNWNDYHLNNPIFGDPGYYLFENFWMWGADPDIGSFIIREHPFIEWVQSAPADDYYVQPIRSGQDITGLNFGNYQPVTIDGFKYNDLNGDGERQPGEAGLPGWVIFLDQDDDGVLDGGETWAVTDGTGAYSFPGLVPGRYIVAEVQKPLEGWVQSYPNPADPLVRGRHVVTLQSGQISTANLFGNWQYGRITGSKFEDLDADGMWDWEDLDLDGFWDADEPALEPALAGWTVFLDADLDGALDWTDANGDGGWNPGEGEQWTVTGADGRYTLTGVAVGPHQVAEVLKTGWVQSFPGTRTQWVTVISGTEHTGVNFGNYRPGVIGGIKWEDWDGDGMGPTQGDFDADGLPIDIPDDNVVEIPLLVSGLADGICDVNLTLSITHTYVSDLNIVLISPEGAQITLFDGAWYAQANPAHQDGDNFINTVFDDAATTDIYDGVPAFTGSFVPDEVLAGLNGQDPNGTWLLRVSDTSVEDVGYLDAWSLFIRSGADESGLPGWRIFLDDNGNGVLDWRDANGNGVWDEGVGAANEGERWVRTDADGEYVFDNLRPGRTYVVREQNLDPALWIQTFPGVPGSHAVAIISGDVVINRNFGNVLGSTIRGAKFEDVNGDGVWNWSDTDGDGHWDGDELPLEPALADWEIHLLYDSDGNDMVEGDELITPIAVALTTTSGYEFAGLRPGRYVVREVLPAAGWFQTAPESGTHEVVLIAGSLAEDLDFGNARAAAIHGIKWEDMDADGVKDPMESGLAGWTVYIDVDNDGELDVDVDPTAVTDAAGAYKFENLRPNDPDDPNDRYVIREVLRAGWFQSFPDQDPAASEPQIVRVAPGQVKRNINFGNWQYGWITGIKFHDLNRNGILDAGEGGLAGWEIFIDADGDGAWDEDELRTWTAADDPATPTVNETGTYRFDDLKPGSYTLVEQPQDGWAQTAPLPGGPNAGAHVVQVRSHQGTGGIDFGNVEATSGITGRVRNDVDIDRVAPRRATFHATSVPRDIPDEGTVEISLNVSGMPLKLVDVNVMLSITHPYDADVRVVLVSPGGTTIVLFDAIGGEGDNFTATVLDDQADTDIGDAAAPFTGTFRPQEVLAGLNGQNPNGTWRLRVTDLSDEDIGRLENWSLSVRGVDPEDTAQGAGGWTVYIDANANGQRDSGERGTTTAADGTYAFTGLLPGYYRIALVVKDGLDDDGQIVDNRWELTYPASGVQIVPDLAVGQIVEEIDFGVRSFPVGDDVTLTIDEDEVLHAQATGQDVEGDPLSFAIVAGPVHGSVVMASDGSFTYTPNAHFNGSDEFTFRASDARGSSEPAKVRINVDAVNDVPLVTDTSLVINEDTPITFALDGMDVETPTALLTFTLTDGPDHGTLVLTGGVADYTPALNYHGPDSFTYTVTDTGDGAAGPVTSPAVTVSIDVVSVNDAPVADSQVVPPTVAVDGAVSVVLTGSDVETPTDQLVFAIFAQPLYGHVTLVGTTATYRPDNEYAGQQDTFTFSVSDGSLVSTGTVAITVLPSDMTVDAPAGRIVNYVDGDGTRVRVTLINTGARLIFSGFMPAQQTLGRITTVAGSSLWIRQSDLLDTNPGAMLFVTAYGGDNAARMGTLTGTARLTRLVGPGLIFDGDGIQMTGEGTIDLLLIRDVRDGADIVLPGAAGGIGMTIIAHQFGFGAGDGTQVVLGRPLTCLSLAQFDDGSLTAPYARVIRTIGDARNALAGDFRADLNLTGAGRPEIMPALVCAYARGDASGNWVIQGPVISLIVVKDLEYADIQVVHPVDPRRYAVTVLNVVGSMDHVRLRTSGNVNAVIARAIRHSDIYAGVVDGVTGLPDPYTQINAPDLGIGAGPSAKINRVIVRGLPAFDPVTRRIIYSYVASNIAAYNVGVVSIRNADPLAEEPFGIACWQARRLIYTDSFNTRDNWIWPAPRGFSAIPAGQFTVNMGMVGVESFLLGERITADLTTDSPVPGADIAASYMRVLGDWVYIGLKTARPFTALDVKAVFRVDISDSFGALTDAADPHSDFQIEFDRGLNDVAVLTGRLSDGQLVLDEVDAPGAAAVVTSAGVLVKVPVTAFAGYEFFHLTRGSLVTPAGQVLDRTPN